MEIKYKRIIGFVVGVAVVGGTVYAIKKYYDEKKQSEESFGLDEAKHIVEEGRENLNLDQIDDVDPAMEETKMDSRNQAFVETNFDKTMDYGTKDGKPLTEEEMERMIDDARDEAHWNSSFSPDRDTSVRPIVGIKPDELAATLEAMEEQDEEDLMEGPDPEEVQNSKGYFAEDKEVIDDLRYEPNSIEAREQFINMELANLGRDNDTRDVIAMLFDHPFNPIGDEDHNLRIRLMDHRINFFTEKSKWVNEVTYGDLIMYYGKAAEFNCQEDVRYWVDYFLTCADINDIMLTSDEFEERINHLNNHNYFNEGLQSHGLFGLNSFQMTECIREAQRRVDRLVTYDIEFHRFISGVVGH